MPTTALDTFGTTLTLNGVPIVQMQDISGPEISRDTEDITNHSSPSQWEEHLPTIKRSGNVTFPLIYIPGNAAHEAFFTALDDGSLDAYALRAPDNSGWDFSGYVTSLSETYPVAGHLARNATIKVSGAPTKVDPS